jgi:hypothetical protein
VSSYLPFQQSFVVNKLLFTWTLSSIILTQTLTFRKPKFFVSPLTLARGHSDLAGGTAPFGPPDNNCKDDLTNFMLSLQDLSPGTSLQEIPLNMNAETAVLASNDTNVDHNALPADTLNELCDGNACELNAVSYVAGYIASNLLGCILHKVALPSRRCSAI